MKLLHIIASPRGAQSRTRQVSAAFLTALQAKYPDLLVEDFDLFAQPLEEVTAEAVDAKYAKLTGAILPEKAELLWPDMSRYATHFLTADVYLITAPMWNFSLPYKLKHYIDLIMQPGLLFRFTEKGVEGLAKHKKMVCVTSRGNNYQAGTALYPFDFQESYLSAIFGLVGITDIDFIHAQPLDVPGLSQTALEDARREASLLATRCELAVPETI